jgi:hypothetical protein
MSKVPGRVWALLVVAVLLVLAAASLLVFRDRVMPAAATPTADLAPSATAPWPTVETRTPTLTSTPTQAPTDTPTVTPAPSPTATVTPTPTPTPIIVNPKIRALGRLEAAQYVMQTVVDLEREQDNVWKKVFGSDKLLLIAEGQVVVGFDLTKLSEEDVSVDGTSVHLLLPPAEILYVGIDEEKTYVYERETGLFVTPDPELETEARQVAQRSVLNWALQHDAFGKAEEFGILYMDAFLRSLGFTDVEIEVYRPIEVENEYSP